MSSEEDMARRVLNPESRRGSLRSIPFTTREQLIDTLERLYPSANEVFIYEADQRDAAGGPVLTTRSLRGLKATVVSRGGRGSSYALLEAKWQVLFVAVEKGFAYVKVVSLSIGEA